MCSSLAVVMAAGACTVTHKPSGEGGEASADGSGGGTDGASETGSQAPSSEPSPQTTAISGVEGGSETTGGGASASSDGGDPSDTDPEATTNGDPTEEPHDDSDTEGDDCNGDTWAHVPEGEADFYDLLDAWDRSGFTPVSCPYEDEVTPCSEAPLAVSALVVRNDALPAPKDFVTGSARWLIWSNAALSCADPMGAPLCAGEWRVSLAIYAEMWCHSVREYPGEHGFGFGSRSAYLIEAGDENCETTAHTVADDDVSSVRVRFADNGVLPPYFEAEKGIEVCAACQVPGAPAVITGTFDAMICPE